MTTTQSKETQARQRFARRIEHGHLTRDELWQVAALVRAVGIGVEFDRDDAETQWDFTVREYRRLIPEGGETACAH